LAVEVLPEKMEDGIAVDAWVQRQSAARDFLSERIKSLPAVAAAQVALTAEDQRVIADENAAASQGAPVKVGVVKQLDLDVDLSLFYARRIDAFVTDNPLGVATVNGDQFDWAMRLDVLDSGGVRLRLDEVRLPPGAKLYLYNDQGDVRGPYSGNRKSFWTHSIPGGSLYLHLIQPTSGLETASLKVSAALLLDSVPLAFCAANATCIQDGACYDSSDWSKIDVARAAIAQILFIENGFGFACTGGLLADTDAGSVIPYFLTAHHCVGSAAVAATVETRFNYTTSACGGPCVWPRLPSTNGATLLDTSPADDHTLLRLDEIPPAGAWMLGWKSEPVAYTDDMMLYRLSHPQQSPQAYSTHRITTSGVGCSGLPRGSFIYSSNIVGATEPGSSGSPVMLATGQVVGQLFGSCGTNVNQVCDSGSNSTVDGAFANYYSRVAKWLNPPVESADGASVGLYDPNASKFYLRFSNTSGDVDATFQFGSKATSWIPLAADWNGNGQTTVGLFNRANSHFYLRNSNNAGVSDMEFQYGSSKSVGWIPLVGDWDGNGTATVGFFNPSNSTFYLRNSNSAGDADLKFQFGSSKNPHWIPVTGDWDGNGTTTVGLFNPDNSSFYLRNSNSAGDAQLKFQFGPRNSDWIPLAGDWNDSGAASVGLFNVHNSTFYLRNSLTAGVANLTFKYGSPGVGWQPLVGHWTSP